MLIRALAVTALLLIAACAGESRTSPAQVAASIVPTRGAPSGAIGFSPSDIYVTTRWPSALIRIDKASMQQSVTVLSKNDRNPAGVAIEQRTGTVWVALTVQRKDRRDSVAIVAPSGKVSELALPRHTHKLSPVEIVADGRGNMWVAGSERLLWKILAATHRIDEIPLADRPQSLVADGQGAIWFVQGGQLIRRIDRFGKLKTMMPGRFGSYVGPLSVAGSRVWYIRATRAPRPHSFVGHIDMSTTRTTECAIGPYGTRIASTRVQALYVQNGSADITAVTNDCIQSQYTTGSRIEAIAIDPYSERTVTIGGWPPRLTLLLKPN